MRKPLYPQGRIVYVTLFSLAIFLCLTGLLAASDLQSRVILKDSPAIEAAAPNAGQETGTEGVSLAGNDRALYPCQMKIYVVEPTSRYKDYYGHTYEFGFLDFAYDTSLNLDYQVPFSRTINWDPAANGVGTIQQSNIMVIAVIYNHLEAHPSFTTDGSDTIPFTAYYSDACAAAIPGEIGYNDDSGPYTHTVFLEEATWSS